MKELIVKMIAFINSGGLGMSGLQLRAELEQELVHPTLPWVPIAELADRYEPGLLLLAPELLDEDFNESGAGMGYWQDDRDVPCGPNGAIREEGVDYGGWLACKWNGTCDEWMHVAWHVACTPTHYIKLTGVR